MLKKIKNRFNAKKLTVAPSPVVPAAPSSNPVAGNGSVTTEESSDSVSGESLEGRMQLKVVLPDGQAVTVAVERSTPMGDLLVQLTKPNKLSPGGHMLNVNDAKDSVTYKPSTAIGSLNASVVYVVPKIAMKRHSSSSTLPFEATFRLRVHLPKGQLHVIRVSPTVPLSRVLSQVCEERGLSESRYELRHSTYTEEKLDYNRSLSDYNLTEVAVVGIKSAAPVPVVTTSDIMAMKARKTSETGSSRGESPVRSDVSSKRSASPARPPRLGKTAMAKKRQAPPPPPRPLHPPTPSPVTETTVTSSHSRHSSDSSGYHEPSVLSDSAETPVPPAPVVITSSSSSSVTSLASVAKKRQAPVPPKPAPRVKVPMATTAERSPPSPRDSVHSRSSEEEETASKLEMMNVEEPKDDVEGSSDAVFSLGGDDDLAVTPEKQEEAEVVDGIMVEGDSVSLSSGSSKYEEVETDAPKGSDVEDVGAAGEQPIAWEYKLPDPPLPPTLRESPILTMDPTLDILPPDDPPLRESPPSEPAPPPPEDPPSVPKKDNPPEPCLPLVENSHSAEDSRVITEHADLPKHSNPNNISEKPSTEEVVLEVPNYPPPAPPEEPSPVVINPPQPDVPEPRVALRRRGPLLNFSISTYQSRTSEYTDRDTSDIYRSESIVDKTRRFSQPVPEKVDRVPPQEKTVELAKVQKVDSAQQEKTVEVIGAPEEDVVTKEDEAAETEAQVKLQQEYEKLQQQFVKWQQQLVRNETVLQNEKAVSTSSVESLRQMTVPQKHSDEEIRTRSLPRPTVPTVPKDLGGAVTLDRRPAGLVKVSVNSWNGRHDPEAETSRVVLGPIKQPDSKVVKDTRSMSYAGPTTETINLAGTAFRNPATTNKKFTTLVNLMAAQAKPNVPVPEAPPKQQVTMGFPPPAPPLPPPMSGENTSKPAVGKLRTTVNGASPPDRREALLSAISSFGGRSGLKKVPNNEVKTWQVRHGSLDSVA